MDQDHIHVLLIYCNVNLATTDGLLLTSFDFNPEVYRNISATYFHRRKGITPKVRCDYRPVSAILVSIYISSMLNVRNQDPADTDNSSKNSRNFLNQDMNTVQIPFMYYLITIHITRRRYPRCGFMY